MCPWFPMETFEVVHHLFVVVYWPGLSINTSHRPIWLLLHVDCAKGECEALWACVWLFVCPQFSMATFEVVVAPFVVASGRGSVIYLNEEAGYKRARPGRKQCLYYHIRHMSQYGCIAKILELSAMPWQWRQLFYT